MTPRNLAVFRIDDGLQTHGDVPPRYIDIHQVSDPRWGEVACISDFSTALRYWSSPRLSAGPDLVTADVLFDDDRRSPLNRGIPPLECPSVYNDRPLPTGLTHLKPFVAYARACGKPMGIGVHTRSPDLWRLAWDAQHVMGALAVAEIAEVVALLGEHLEGEGLAQTAENCWTWLLSHRATDFRGALAVALEDYRRRLLEMAQSRPGEAAPQVMILPGDWCRLTAWVRAQAARAQPEPLPADLDLPLLSFDGRIDRVRIASIFADAVGIRGLHFPARCYQTQGEADTEAWRFDSLNPQFGRFIERLGWLGRAYESALRVLGEFPDEPPPTDPVGDPAIRRNLNQATHKMADDDLVAGLVVIFQAVRWECRKFLAWQTVLVERGWDVLTQTFELVPNSPTPGQPASERTVLVEVLDDLASIAWWTPQTNGTFHLQDLRQRFPESWNGARGVRETKGSLDWLKWHLARLVEAGFLEERGFNGADDVLPGRGYRVVNRVPGMSRRPPLRPEDIPAPHDWSPEGDPRPYDSFLTFLRVSLGFNSDNRNAIARIIRHAFSPGSEGSDVPVGNTFIEALFCEGRAPAWIFHLLQDFARDQLGWTNARTWPHWLRGDGLGVRRF